MSEDDKLLKFVAYTCNEIAIGESGVNNCQIET